ncbi:hypothetical protein OOK27_51085 [Streptomyces canus]|uniref:hypothetical protein n=1 Tax=Streptomyces canus TaxID=58343 RepID=UPI00224C87B8|nr:hypothetical protein [Streptomyces canus]MCX5262368.1 hypothetical protein [Streptomyces canus]
MRVGFLLLFMAQSPKALAHLDAAAGSARKSLGGCPGSTRLLAEVATHRDYTTISVGRVDDLLACVALENKNAVLARSHQITRTNLAVLDEWVTGRDDITYVKPASGTTGLLRYNAPIGSYEFCTRLLVETGVMFTPGAAFDIEHTVRIGFADDAETLCTGLELVGPDSPARG